MRLILNGRIDFMHPQPDTFCLEDVPLDVTLWGPTEKQHKKTIVNHPT